MKGWFFDSYRHSLASKGVKTTESIKNFRGIDESEIPPKELHDIDWDVIKYYWVDLTDTLLEDKRWSERLFKMEVDKSIEHAKEIEKVIQMFWWCSYHNQWEWFDFDLIADSIGNFLEERIEFYKILYDLAPGSFEIKEMHYDALEKTKEYNPSWNKQKKIVWFDELIHMEHERGLVLVELNMSLNALREYFEREYL